LIPSRTAFASAPAISVASGRATLPSASAGPNMRMTNLQSIGKVAVTG
jgi:hypothetical protein